MICRLVKSSSLFIRICILLAVQLQVPLIKPSVKVLIQLLLLIFESCSVLFKGETDGTKKRTAWSLVCAHEGTLSRLH